MMQIIQKRKYTYFFSTILTIASVILLFTVGLKFGIDFKGGTLMEVQFLNSKNDSEIFVPSNQEVKEKLADLNLGDIIVQSSDNSSIILRYVASDEETNERVLEKLKGFGMEVEQKRVDFIGSSVSGQIKKNSALALLLAVIGIALYIAWAFRRVSRPIPSMEYGIGAVVALGHDLVITAGVFVLLGKYLNVEVGISFVAALLTILGYSVNDTIVVYDRIRENLSKSNGKENFEEIANRSINETLARSINTSFTVIIVLLAIVLFGGESIKYFAVALLIGVAFGTYSSIFVASSLLVTSYKYKLKIKKISQ